MLTDTLINATQLIGAALGRKPPSSQIHDYSAMDWWYINSMEVGKVRLPSVGEDKKSVIYYDKWAREVKSLLTKKKPNAPSLPKRK